MTSPAVNQREMLLLDQLDQVQRVRIASRVGNMVYVYRDSSATQDAVAYPTIDGSGLIAGDEALMVRVNNNYVVIGRIDSTRTTYPVGPASHLFAEQELVTVSSSNAENNIFSATIPANWFDANRHFRLEQEFDLLANNGGTQTFILRVYLGATKMFEDDSPNMGNQATVMPGRLVITIFTTGGTAQYMSGSIQIASKTAHSAVGLGDIGTLASVSSPFSGVAAENDEVDLTFRVTIQFNASGANLRWQAHHSNLFVQ